MFMHGKAAKDLHVSAVFVQIGRILAKRRVFVRVVIKNAAISGICGAGGQASLST